MSKNLVAVLFCLCSPLVFAQEKLPSVPARIFVSDVSSHDVTVAKSSGAIHSESSGSNDAAQSKTWGTYNSYASSGNYPQMPEVAQAFVNSCSRLVVVTTDQDKADYLFIVNHERFEQVMKHNKTIIVNRAGDVVWGDSTRKLDNAVKDACSFFAKSTPASEESR